MPKPLKWEGNFMNQAWKPPGFNSVNPYLIVREADRLIDF